MANRGKAFQWVIPCFLNCLSREVWLTLSLVSFQTLAKMELIRWLLIWITNWIVLFWLQISFPLSPSHYCYCLIHGPVKIVFIYIFNVSILFESFALVVWNADNFNSVHSIQKPFTVMLHLREGKQINKYPTLLRRVPQPFTRDTRDYWKMHWRNPIILPTEIRIQLRSNRVMSNKHLRKKEIGCGNTLWKSNV